MLHPNAVPFRCCFALLVLQFVVFSVYVIVNITQKRNSKIKTLIYFNQTETELYINGVLNLTSAKNNDECAKKFLDSYSRYCEQAIVPSSKVLNQYYDSSGDWLNKDLCPCLPNNPTWHVDLNLSIVRISDDVFKGMLPGGHWAPSWCIPRQRIAVVIPFRDRADHLEVFVQILHPFLQKQLHSYSIFVIEQKDPEIFNRAAMMNVGFVEITKRPDRVFDCFIFHDVDTLPQDDRNIYGCYRVPRHVAPYINKFKYKLPYGSYFGAATAFTRRQFELLNGHSNEFWGWGGEDDDMHNRLKAARLSYIRFPKCVATYTMIKHGLDTGNPRNPRRAIGLLYRPQVYKRDGLNSLRYTLIDYEERLLYTKIIASLPTPAALKTARKYSSRTPSTSMAPSSIESSTYNSIT